VRIRLLLGTLPAVFLCLGHPARALPGTHAPAVSTYDTRASSVVLAYRHGSSSDGPFNTISYNANFTNTTGKLSAQFGLHYVSYAPKVNNETAHGVAASGVALFEFPVAARWDDGVPKAALSFYVGSVPTIYVSGQRNYLTIPLTLGFAVPLSPHRAITFTPWFEAAPSANLDTIFQPAKISVGPDAVTVTPNATGSFDVALNQGAVEAAVKKGVTINYGFSVPMRVGLETGIHVSQGVDFNLYTGLASLGGGFSGATVLSLGAGLVFRWDDIVPAVLPVERRLDHEGCDAIEARFRSCPNSRPWLSPEQRARQPQATPQPSSAPLTPQPTPLTPQPTPLTPQPTPAMPRPVAAPATSAAGFVPAPKPQAPTPAQNTAAFPN